MCYCTRMILTFSILVISRVGFIQVKIGWFNFKNLFRLSYLFRASTKTFLRFWPVYDFLIKKRVFYLSFSIWFSAFPLKYYQAPAFIVTRKFQTVTSIIMKYYITEGITDHTYRKILLSKLDMKANCQTPQGAK